MRYSLDNKGQIYAKFPNDPVIRGSFYILQREYSKVCKKKLREFKRDLVEKLDNLHENNPKEYWQLLNSVTKDRDNSTESQVSIEEWLNHFSKLNSPPSKFVNRINEIKQILENEEKVPSFSTLNFTIKEKELLTVIHTLKNGKAKGLDGIMNEMIKW